MENYEFKVEVSADERVSRDLLHQVIGAALDELRAQGVKRVEIWDAEESAAH